MQLFSFSAARATLQNAAYRDVADLVPFFGQGFLEDRSGIPASRICTILAIAACSPGVFDEPAVFFHPIAERGACRQSGDPAPLITLHVKNALHPASATAEMIVKNSVEMP